MILRATSPGSHEPSSLPAQTPYRKLFIIITASVWFKLVDFLDGFSSSVGSQGGIVDRVYGGATGQGQLKPR